MQKHHFWMSICGLLACVIGLFIYDSCRDGDPKDILKAEMGKQILEIEHLKQELSLAGTLMANYKLEALGWKQKSKLKNSKKVKITWYAPKLGGMNGKEGESASGLDLKDGWSIAISRDLVAEGWYGCYIDITDKIPTKFRGVRFGMDKLAEFNPITGEKQLNQIDIYVSDPKLIPKEGTLSQVTVSRILPQTKKELERYCKMNPNF